MLVGHQNSEMTHNNNLTKEDARKILVETLIGKLSIPASIEQVRRSKTILNIISPSIF